MASSVAMMPPPPASSSSSSTSMNALESGAPAIGAYDYGAMSQPATQMTQPTQTQTQTQSSQADYAGANARVPVNWWAVLISSVPTPTQAEIEEQGQQRAANGGDTDAYVQRPFRVELHVDSAECIVGRHPRSNLYLAGKKISARHARIYREDDGTVKLEDLSSNGTFVNGVKVGKGKVTPLEHGNEIIFGPATAHFSYDFRYIFQLPGNALVTTSRVNPFVHEYGGTSDSGIHDLYDIREQIGKGSFASVRLGIQRSTGDKVAIKLIQKSRFQGHQQTMIMIRREIDIMKEVQHKYCVRWIDYFEDDTRIWLVMEHVKGGDLLEFVMQQSGLSESTTRTIARMSCEAIAYLHSVGIAHRDIKPENILLDMPTGSLRGADSSLVVKVSDFGLAKSGLDAGTYLKTMCGTPAYLAPEVILNPQGFGYGPAVDAWSLGVVFFCCLTNSTPFDEDENEPLRDRMEKRRVHFDEITAKGHSEMATDFLRNLLERDPMKRMTPREALDHPWLATDEPVLIPQPSESFIAELPPANAPPESSEAGSFGCSQGIGALRLDTPARPQFDDDDPLVVDQPGDEDDIEAADVSLASSKSARTADTPATSHGGFRDDTPASAITTAKKRSRHASPEPSKALVSAFSTDSSVDNATPQPKRRHLSPSSAAPDDDDEDDEDEPRPLRRSPRKSVAKATSPAPAKGASTRRKPRASADAARASPAATSSTGRPRRSR